MFKMHPGRTTLGLPLAFLAIVSILLFSTFGFWNKYVFGNKQMMDFDQRFTVAYILVDDGKWERVKITSWNDYDKSDTIQLRTSEGITIYTHSSNVKLTDEPWAPTK